MHRQGVLETINVSPIPDAGGRGEDGFGWALEAEVSLRWRVTSRFTLSVGAGVFWLGPVTRAHDALDFSQVASNDLGPRFRDDTLLVERAFVGLSLDL